MHTCSAVAPPAWPRCCPSAAGERCGPCARFGATEDCRCVSFFLQPHLVSVLAVMQAEAIQAGREKLGAFICPSSWRSCPDQCECGIACICCAASSKAGRAAKAQATA